MIYLFIALGLVFLGIVLSIGTAVFVAADKIIFAIIGLFLTYASYIAALGFVIVWLGWLIKNL